MNASDEAEEIVRSQVDTLPDYLDEEGKSCRDNNLNFSQQTLKHFKRSQNLQREKAEKNAKAKH